jgi:hypothetical protein
LVCKNANWFSYDLANSGLINLWNRLNSREQLRRTNFSKSVACKVRGPEGVDDDALGDFNDVDVGCRS